MFLIKDTLFNTCWFINVELKGSSPGTHARTKLVSHMYFLHKAHRNLLVFRNTRQLWNYAQRLFVTGKSSIKITMVLKSSTHGLQKAQFTVFESCNIKAGHKLVSLQLGTCMAGVSIFCCSCACPQMTTKVPWVLVVELQIKLADW